MFATNYQVKDIAVIGRGLRFVSRLAVLRVFLAVRRVHLNGAMVVFDRRNRLRLVLSFFRVRSVASAGTARCDDGRVLNDGASC